MYSPKKIVWLTLALVLLAAVAVVVTTGTVGASPRVVPIAAAPTPSVPVTVVNTPLPVTGTVTANLTGTSTLNANITNPSLTVGNVATSPLFGEDVNKMPAHLVSDGRSFSLPPDPNIAFEFDLPTNVVLTDVQLSLNAPSLAATVFVSDQTDKTFIFQSVGTPGSTSAASADGRVGIHLQSGLTSSIGLRVGLYCPNIGGNSCSGALMWSGYQP